jgi:uracil-DNA glycosylase
MKLLIVGQAPSRVQNPDEPALWDSASLRSLARYGSLERAEELYEIADVVNFFEQYQCPPFNVHGLMQCAPTVVSNRMDELEDQIQYGEWTHVVLLGGEVARAFRLHRKDWFDWQPWGNGLTQICKSPHPSGKNRWWNDADNRWMGEQFWTSTLARASTTALAPRIQEAVRDSQITINWQGVQTGLTELGEAIRRANAAMVLSTGGITFRQAAAAMAT